MWHGMTRDFYENHTPPARIMRMHPLFSHYVPTPPININLSAISFWDTSTEPHRELRFLGPGDVSTMLYCEVDTFASFMRTAKLDANGQVIVDDEDDAEQVEKEKEKPKFERVLLGGNVHWQKKQKKYEEMRDPNQNGDGRWSFVLIKGVEKNGVVHKGVAPPWVTIAWPTNTVTQKGECMYTVFPDAVENPFAEPIPSSSSGFGGEAGTTHYPSTPIIAPWATVDPPSAAKVGPKKGLPKLRRENTMPILPFAQPGAFGTFGAFAFQKAAPEPAPTAPPQRPMPPPVMPCRPMRDDAWTLKRTTMLFEKTGGLPLVDAYRTDAAGWKGFMNAVAMGKGKIQMYVDT
jgi:hypothetical protein